MTRIAMPGRTTVDDPLAFVTAPPPGETAEETELRLHAEAEAKRVSDEIDEELRLEKLAERRTRSLRILLLGASRVHGRLDAHRPRRPERVWCVDSGLCYLVAYYGPGKSTTLKSPCCLTRSRSRLTPTRRFSAHVYPQGLPC